MRSIEFLVAAAVIFCAAPALAQEHSAHGVAHGAASADPAYDALKMVDEKMMKEMGAIKPSGDPDVDFVNMMIPHHQSAIDMAEVELKYGKDESRKALARDIIKTQQAEIAEMKDWLMKKGK
jgi:uncharacterized protein (DUF305 family)